MEDELDLPRLSRRDVLKWFAAVAAATQVGPFLRAQDGDGPAEGYGKDPLLTKHYNAGDVWPLTLSEKERAATTALADFILPADAYGPAASALRVPDFIDEWVSAPYSSQQSSRKTILPGLRWIDEEATRRFGKTFASLKDSEKEGICKDICDTKTKNTEFREASVFFSSFRSLAMGAYYGTPEGWKAIGYVGNVPLPSFEGPPQEVLDQVGVQQTVR